MPNNDITRISSNLIRKEKLGASKKIDNRRGDLSSSQNPATVTTPPADVTISEEGIKRLETSKINVDKSLDPNETMKSISKNVKDFIKAQTGMSPSKVAELLKD